jgi:hypothetical protein
MLSIPHFLHSLLTDCGKAVSPRHWPRFAPRSIIFLLLVLISANPQNRVHLRQEMGKVAFPHVLWRLLNNGASLKYCENVVCSLNTRQHALATKLDFSASARRTHALGLLVTEVLTDHTRLSRWPHCASRGKVPGSGISVEGRKHCGMDSLKKIIPHWNRVILKLVVCILLRLLDKIQGFRLTQHWFEYFIQLPLHVSVLWPSSSGNIFLYAVRSTCVYNLKVGCLHPVACTRSGSGFPSNATLFSIFYSVTATCFGLVTIFKRKYFSVCCTLDLRLSYSWLFASCCVY